MNKITPPSDGTKADEANRTLFDAAVSGIPGVGGPLVTFIRHIFPSRRDIKRDAWENTVSDVLTDTSHKIDRSEAKIDRLSADHVSLDQRINETETLAEKTATELGSLQNASTQGVLAEDHLDGELAICRELFENGQFHTALKVLRSRFGDEPQRTDIAATTLARIRSLEGLCLHSLGNAEEAATCFLSAINLDPSTKHRSNAVVAHLTLGDLNQAKELLDDLLAEEPNQARHWANLIYLESAQGRVVAEDEVSPIARDNIDVRLAFANVLRIQEDPSWRDHAQANAKLFPYSDEARRAGAEAAIETLTTAMRLGAPEGTSIAAIRHDAVSSAEALRELWIEHKTSEVFQHDPDVVLLQNTALSLTLTGKREEAASLADQHFELLRQEPSALLMVGMIALDSGMERLLDRVLDESFEGDWTIRVERAMRQGDFKAALHLVEPWEDSPPSDDQIAPARLAEMLRAATSDPANRANALQDVLSAHAPDGHSDLVLSNICERAGVPEVANAALDRALSTDFPGDTEFRHRLAAAAMNREQPGEVIDLLDDFVDPTFDSSERDRLAQAHAMVSPPRASGLRFFSQVRQYTDHAGLQMAGGVYHFNRGSMSEAAIWLRRALTAQPGEAQIVVRLWMALKRSGQDARARKLLNEVDLIELKGATLERLQVARLLWQIGRTEALEFAYDIAAGALDDPDACLLYSNIVLSDAFHSDTPEVTTPDRVTPGVWVRLSRRAGADFEFVLVDEEDDVPFHQTTSHAIAAAAVGLGVGDTFETTDGPNCFEWKVEELKPKALYLFHRISSTFQDHFPGYGGLWMATIEGDDIEPFLQSLRQRRAHVEMLEKAYLENPMPLGPIADAGGSTTIDFALHLARREVGVVSATGRSGDLEAERKQAAEAGGRAIAVDAYTLWLLAKLSLLDAVTNVYPKVFAPPNCTG